MALATEKVLAPRSDEERIRVSIVEVRKELGRKNLNAKQREALTSELTTLQSKLTGEGGEEGLAPDEIMRMPGLRGGPSTLESDERMELSGLDKPGPATTKPTAAPSGPLQSGRIPGPGGNFPPEMIAPSPETLRAGGRIGVETAGGILGTVAGGAMGGPGGAVAGDVLGTMGGSLLSEMFDPTASPKETAAIAGGSTLVAGGLLRAGAVALRSIRGGVKPTAKDLVHRLAREGIVPSPGLVFEGEFIQNAQSYGAASMFTNNIKKNLEQIEGVLGADIRNYVSGFQRYKDASQKLFTNVDSVLSNTGVKMKFDKETLAPLKNAIALHKRRGVGSDMVPALQKVEAFLTDPEAASLSLNFKEAQDASTILFTMARQLERSSVLDAGEVGGQAIPGLMRQRARAVRGRIDETIDALIANRRIDGKVKKQLAGARELWSRWETGEELSDILIKSTSDVLGEGPVSGKKMLEQLDIMAREETLKKGRVVSARAIKNMTKFAKALDESQAAGKETGFQFVARSQQVFGMYGIGMAAILGSPAGAMGAAGMVMAPHVLDFMFVNEKAFALMMRNFKMEPGSAALATVSRRLLTLMAQEGIIGIERVPTERTDTTGQIRRQMQR